MVNLTIDGRNISVEDGATILQAAEAAGIMIPTLCYNKRLNPLGSCRMCLVEVEGYDNPMTACTTPAVEGIRVCTHSERLQRMRRENLKLILVNHPLDCPICDKGGECALQDIVYEFGIEKSEYQAEKQERTRAYATPLIRFWPDRCIMCLRCVAACRDIKALGAIDIAGSGFGTQISPVNKDRCESCGECIRLCPTGALTENLSRRKGRIWMVNRVKTTCTYCGCGCQLELNVANDRVIGVTTRDGEGINKGSLCVRGRFGYEFIGSEDRLTKPLIKKDGVFQEATWDEALNLIAGRLGAIKAASGADAIAGLASARCTNEDNYLFQKFMRAVMGTNNIDQCAGLGDSAAAAGLAAAFGSGAATNPIADVLKSETIFLTGSNITENHPIFANYVKEAVFRKGAKLIVADPRKIELVDYATIWLRQKPGTDVACINGLIHIILRENLHDNDYIQERTEGFEKLKTSVEKYTPEYVSDVTGISVADLTAAARMYGQAKPASILCAIDIAEPATGTDTAKALANLAMLCGNVGVEGGGVNLLRGQNNAQGVCDMGALPDVFPDYQKVADSALREKFSEAWGVSLPGTQGLNFVGMMDAAAEGKIKGMYILGENPLLSDPDSSHSEAALKTLDFLVVQDIFLTETAKLAHVVLPSACFAEKDGTFTNSERIVQRVRKAVSAPGEAKSDGEIIMELANRLGYPMKYARPEQIMEEISRVTPSYGGITYAGIEKEGIPWPCLVPNDRGVKCLHKDRFAQGLGLFQAVEYRAPAEPAEGEYPLILTMGSVLCHDKRGVTARTGKGMTERCPESPVEINPRDAEIFGITDGHPVRVTSRRGTIQAHAKITEHLPQGTVFMSLRLWETAVNLLTNSAFNPAVNIPEYKVCAVKIEAA